MNTLYSSAHGTGFYKSVGFDESDIDFKRLQIMMGLVESVPSGYFAVREQDGDAVQFYRLSRPTKGQDVGKLKIQSLHSEQLVTRLRVSLTTHSGTIYSKRVVTDFVTISVDWMAASMLYANEIGKCARCNTKLTDERSRHYGIGPDCEKVWTDWVARVDEKIGESYESIVEKGMMHG